jgi:hypothetical protein
MRMGLVAAAAVVGIVSSTWGPHLGHADDDEPGEQGSATTLGASLGVMFVADQFDQRVPHLGFRFTHELADRLSLAVVPSFTFFSDGTMIAVPAGLQYDAAVVPRLFFYVRAAAGPAFLIRGASDTVGLVMFDAGFKYDVTDSFFVGVEPISVLFFLSGNPALIFKPVVAAGFSF